MRHPAATIPLALAIALSLAIALCRPAPAQAACFPAPAVSKDLDDLAERPAWRGIARSGHLVAVHQSAGGGWTLTITDPAGRIACVVAFGEDGQRIAPVPEPDGGAAPAEGEQAT